MPHSTLGYERRFNWAFKTEDEAAFVDEVLAGQPDPPTYFATMKRINKEGPPPLGDRPTPRRLDDQALAAALARGAMVIDTRSAAEYARDAVIGTINLPLNGSFVTWAGWLVPYDADFYLLLGDGAEQRLDEMARALALIGLDRLGGYFTSSALAALPAGAHSRIPQIEPAALAGMRGDDVPVVIDVRNDAEWGEGHLPSAVHIPLGRLTERLAEPAEGAAAGDAVRRRRPVGDCRQRAAARRFHGGQQSRRRLQRLDRRRPPDRVPGVIDKRLVR